MANRFPEFLQALSAYGDNLFAQARNTGISYTTLREWVIYGGTPSVNKIAHLPDLLTAYSKDIANQATSTVNQTADIAA